MNVPDCKGTLVNEEVPFRSVKKEVHEQKKLTFRFAFVPRPEASGRT